MMTTEAIGIMGDPYTQAMAQACIMALQRRGVVPTNIPALAYVLKCRRAEGIFDPTSAGEMAARDYLEEALG